MKQEHKKLHLTATSTVIALKPWSQIKADLGQTENERGM